MDAEVFHFLRPAWLLGVPAALVMIWWWIRNRRSGSHWQDQVDPELLSVLLEESEQQDDARGAVWLGLVLFTASLALAGPAWERLPQPVEQSENALTIVLDLSLSMYAQDTEPSRLIRARHKITDILNDRKEGFTALVAYAGSAHVVAPLTDDANTIANLLAALNPAMMPVLGSNLDEALDEAHNLFRQAGIGQGRILVITDGIDDMASVTRHADPRFPISVLGVGTPAGAPIPLDFVNQPGRHLTNQTGEVVVARLDDARLQRVARLCHGRYRTLQLSDADIRHLLATPLPQDDETIEVDRQFDAWKDAGYWLAAGLLPLVLFGFRRGVLAAVCIVVLPVPTRADVWDDLWLRRDQQAYQELQEGQPETAAQLFTDPDWRGVAEYRSHNFEDAASIFAGAPTPTGNYNLGNTLARLGRYDDALAAYDRTLAADPDHEDALFNKALVERLLAQQPQRSDEDNPQSRSSDGDGDAAQDSRSGSQNPSQEDSEDPSQGDQPQTDDESSEPSEQQSGTKSDPEDGKTEETESLANRDENADAVEQWLRRVPDDPGGLLRRKFKYETNQRLRRGDYGSRQPEKIW